MVWQRELWAVGEGLWGRDEVGLASGLEVGVAMSRSGDRISTRTQLRAAAAAKVADAASSARPAVASFLAAQAQVVAAEQAMAAALIELQSHVGGLDVAAEMVGLDDESARALVSRVAASSVGSEGG
ncbi:MAG: hypothetical protein WBB00_04435 [Mycobacterium sp.]|jgi:hypothetical protein